MLQAFSKAKISSNPKVGRKVARVLVIYTGGTIGMKPDGEDGYTVVPNYFATALKKLPMLYDEEYDKSDVEELEDEDIHPYNHYPRLVMPLSKMGVRVYYYVKEHNPILDSVNMSMENWTSIAFDIKSHYKLFDSFIVLHGTDTMAYTASALSFMLQNLGKTVIMTGSQIPIFEQRNDARSNFVGALTIAGHFIIPEVTIFFNNKLLRGNRSQKISSSDLDAFGSSNLPPLARMGTRISVTWDAVFPQTTIEEFSVHETMSENVGLLRIFPGINARIVNAFLQEPMEGVVLESFGAGNMPSNRPDLNEEFRQASKRGVIIVNITQCYNGSVSHDYATGKALLDLGIIPGYDMTPEAALTKLAYVISMNELSLEEKKEMLSSNIRGEMTDMKPTASRYNMKDGEFVQAVARSLRVGSEKEMNCVRRALLPVLLTCAAKSGDLDTIKQLVEQGANLNEPSDYDGKTSLHIACGEGNVEIVKFLLLHGASVYVRDRRDRTPLFDALRNSHSDVVEVLQQAGAHFQHDDVEVAREVCLAVKENDLDRLRLWQDAIQDMSLTDLDGRTPLHVAVLTRNVDMVNYLVFELKVDISKEDVYGVSALDMAKKMALDQIVDILTSEDLPPRKNSLLNVEVNGY